MRFASVCAFSQLALAATVPASQYSEDACAAAGRLAQTTENYATNDVKVIDANVAYDCLRSLPFDKARAGKFLEEVRKYLQFQTTLEALKNPPDTYLSPSTDILGGLDKIAKTRYHSQHQFDMDLFNLVMSANDGHFSIGPCSLTAFIFFRGGRGLVSVSKDGKDMPEIYAGEDVKALDEGSTNVSPVVTINGRDVITYLEEIAARSNQQDPDARWNTLFVSDWRRAGSPTNKVNYLGRFVLDNGLWPGTDNTRLRFQNGSTVDLATYAVYEPKKAYPSAKEMFKGLCIPLAEQEKEAAKDKPKHATPTTVQATPTPTPAAASTSIAPTFTAGPLGYPEPFARDGYNNIVGFNLDDDTAVMFMPTMKQASGPANEDFVVSSVASKIVDTALASGRSKLIIDLSANGGGDINRAFDLFKLFFPSKFPYSATRLRRHPALEIIEEALREVDATRGGPVPFFWQSMVDPQQDKGFASVDDLLEGETQLGVPVTSLFANFNFTSLSEGGLKTSPIRGFGGAPINKTQPYKPEDILIITDGYCASTCTTFVNLMTYVGGVRSVAFGGRPRAGPMQIMGGVRGGQFMAWSGIDTYIEMATHMIETKPVLTKAQKALAETVLPMGVTNLPLTLGSASVNLRNAYQEGADHLPLQFQYQAADCRLFYTTEGIKHPEKNWAHAKAAIWGGGSCVENSTGGKGSLEDRRSKARHGTHVHGLGHSGTNAGQGGATPTPTPERVSMAGSGQLQGAVVGLCVIISTLLSVM